jgi:hypothetical protein
MYTDTWELQRGSAPAPEENVYKNEDQEAPAAAFLYTDKHWDPTAAAEKRIQEAMKCHQEHRYRYRLN